MKKHLPYSLILAAGEGTRMRSSRPKVLHEIACTPLLGHVLQTVEESFGTQAPCGVVIGPDRQDVAACVAASRPGSEVFIQHERKGTAHAVLMAKKALKANEERPLLILYGDTPLLTHETLNAMVNEIHDGAHVCVLGFEAQDPTGYGRIIASPTGEITAIREHKDASTEELKIRFCNAGVMALSGHVALALLSQISNDNAKGEFYLTDVVEIARKQGLKVMPKTADEQETLGANTREELSTLEFLMQERLRQKVMAEGVTLIDPHSVFLTRSSKIAQDVVIEPNVFIGQNVNIGQGTRIKAFCHIEGAEIGAHASIGPFARLRPQTKLSDDVKIGNFVELKKATLETGAKVSHLSYIGDATIGEEVNIGAGTITCNYDGYNKAQTVIKARAFIGSNTALVAPVTIGEGAIVGAGSAITEDVKAGDLSLTRAPQNHKAGWASAFHAKQTSKTDKKN